MNQPTTISEAAREAFDKVLSVLDMSCHDLYPGEKNDCAKEIQIAIDKEKEPTIHAAKAFEDRCSALNRILNQLRELWDYLPEIENQYDDRLALYLRERLDKDKKQVEQLQAMIAVKDEALRKALVIINEESYPLTSKGIEEALSITPEEALKRERKRNERHT